MKRNDFPESIGINRNQSENDRENDLKRPETTENDRNSHQNAHRFFCLVEWIPLKFPDFPLIFLDFPCKFPDISIKILIFASFFILIE